MAFGRPWGRTTKERGQQRSAVSHRGLWTQSDPATAGGLSVFRDGAAVASGYSERGAEALNREEEREAEAAGWGGGQEQERRHRRDREEQAEAAPAGSRGAGRGCSGGISVQQGELKSAEGPRARRRLLSRLCLFLLSGRLKRLWVIVVWLNASHSRLRDALPFSESYLYSRFSEQIGTMPSMTVTSAAMRVLRRKLQSSRGLNPTSLAPTGGIAKNFPAPHQRISTASPQRTAEEEEEAMCSTTPAASSETVFTKGTKVRVRTRCAGRLCTGQRLVLVLDAVVFSASADGYVVYNGDPLKTMLVGRDEVKRIDAATG
ncbi:hypothetical protein BRADI_1g26743v3 [Brachypodium distachyon]|uniref:Uncharacterized protein n=1 Tax=Brachypodium distachyon TaxID=15368 RepID=A0A0Q3JVH8_BRADI|nr:hypothetical protein BRADI_1g26743v3 [Brachypodium distachyon]